MSSVRSGRADSPRGPKNASGDETAAADKQADQQTEKQNGKKTGGSNNKILMAVVVGFVAVGVYFLSKNVDMKQAMEGAVAYIEGQGDFAMVVYLALTFAGVVCLVPTTPMEFAGGFLFSASWGMWTTWFLTSLAKLAANVVSVFIARNVVKEWVKRNFVEKYDLLTMVSQAVEEEPFKMAFLVRGSMVPLAVKNYGLGVMPIGYLPIALCSCIFTPFYAFQNIYLGSSCQNLKEVFSPKSGGVEKSWFDTGKALMPIFFNVLLVIFLMKAVKSQMKKQKVQIEENLKKKSAKAE